MIKRISWSECWTTVGKFITAYYTVILILHYKKEILQFIARKPEVQE